MNSLVSIIIPCYNARQTIEKAIKSALGQTYPNIEIIVINDGSFDESVRVVQNMMLGYKNIILISTKNQGASSARNMGIEQAGGKYIAFLDADDIYSEKFVEVLVCAIEEHDCDTSYCRWTRNDFDDDIVFSEELPAVFLRKQIMKRINRVSFVNYLYKKDMLLRNGILFPTDLKYGEDNLFVMMYLSCCKKAVSIDAGLYRYCDNKGSAMHKATWDMTDSLKSVKRIEEILVGTPVHMSYCKFAYPRALWALLKDYAVLGNYELFLKLDKEYEVKKYMRQLIRHPDAELIVRISAWIYCVNKEVFYNIISRMTG